MQVTNPFKLGFGMGIRMRRMRSMRFIDQGLTRSIKALVPTHKRSFRDVVTTADKAYPDTGTIKFNGVKSCEIFASEQITEFGCHGPLFLL